MGKGPHVTVVATRGVIGTFLTHSPGAATAMASQRVSLGGVTIQVSFGDTHFLVSFMPFLLQ